MGHTKMLVLTPASLHYTIPLGNVNILQSFIICIVTESIYTEKHY